MLVLALLSASSALQITQSQHRLNGFQQGSLSPAVSSSFGGRFADADKPTLRARASRMYTWKQSSRHVGETRINVTELTLKPGGHAILDNRRLTMPRVQGMPLLRHCPPPPCCLYSGSWSKTGERRYNVTLNAFGRNEQAMLRRPLTLEVPVTFKVVAVGSQVNLHGVKWLYFNKLTTERVQTTTTATQRVQTTTRRRRTTTTRRRRRSSMMALFC